MIILEGCNGEWAQKYYLPFLVQKALEGNVELWAVDIEPQIKLSTPIAASWQAAQNRGVAHYLNKAGDKESYEMPSEVGDVFIVTPDQYHCEVAEFWLERLAPEGKIFIEKPLDASLEQAKELGRKIAGRNIVYGFDHYLANTYPFLQNKASYLGEIGKINEIEFCISEPSEIPRQREKTLDKGVIFDLFCHVLALVGAVVSKGSTCSAAMLSTVDIKEVKAAKYVNCPISGETFAWIKFIVNNEIQVDSTVGKCIGDFEEKFMRLYGADGNIKLDFVENKFSVFDSQGRQTKQGVLNEKHVESFLKGILQGKEHPLSVPGVLTFDIALEILKILGEAKRQIGKIPDYPCQESISQILERF